jgi:type I restriction enzyme M protein
MAKKAKEKQKDITEILNAGFAGLRKKYSEFSKQEPLDSDLEFVRAGMVYGQFDGKETPRILLIMLAEGNWGYSDPARFQELLYQLLEKQDDDKWPRFAHLSDNKNERCYELFTAQGVDPVDEIPSIGVINEYKKLKSDPTLKWSLKIYTKLMHDLDAFHEQVYQTVKDRVNDKNDIIDEVAKILFLESFRVHHSKELTFTCKEKTLNFQEVFDYNYVRKHGKVAVEQIKAAFEELKGHKEFVTTDDKGEDHPIFDPDTHLRLAQPANYETLLRAIQDLGPVEDNKGRVIKERGNLGDVSGDILGRVFDVFLRANFESKGGLGVYLTPNPVKQAMLSMVFHDILQDTETVSRLTTRDEHGRPVFRFCDPTCGSYGFGSVAKSHLRAALDEIPMQDSSREKLFAEMLEYSFVGADSAPRMVMLARVNMALQGANKAKIFYTDNSLTTESLKPCSFDLICTNPPFGTPKFGKGKAQQKKEYQEKMNTILAGFRSDLKNVSTTKKEKMEYYPTVSGLALGSKPNSKGIWIPVKGGSIDPAVLFIDRCLQLLKPGGRLLIILPDGVLCNSSDRYVREYIMGSKDASGEFVGGKAIVKAVISLPADTFKLSGTGAKTSVLYLQKRHASPDDPQQFLPEPQTDVFMAVAETLGYVVKNNIEDYDAGVPNDLDKIVGAYRRGE